MLWISAPTSFIYWISLDTAERISKRGDVAEIRAGLASGDYVAVEKTKISLVAEDDLTDEAKMHRDKIWNMLKDALEKESEWLERRFKAVIKKKKELI